MTAEPKPKDLTSLVSTIGIQDKSIANILRIFADAIVQLEQKIKVLELSINDIDADLKIIRGNKP